jgi:hypothetical protein
VCVRKFTPPLGGPDGARMLHILPPRVPRSTTTPCATKLQQLVPWCLPTYRIAAFPYVPRYCTCDTFVTQDDLRIIFRQLYLHEVVTVGVTQVLLELSVVRFAGGGRYA